MKIRFILFLAVLTTPTHADLTAGKQDYLNMDLLGAFRESKSLSDKNDPLGQYSLGFLYYEAVGIVEDKSKAIEMFTKSANQGFAPAQHKLAEAYERGQGVPIDLKKSMYWLKKAVDNNLPKALTWLGSNYYHGTGVKKDLKLAREWWEKAAYQGENTAQRNLGATYYNGEGVPVDIITSFAWFRLSFEYGNEEVKSFWDKNFAALSNSKKNQVEERYQQLKKKIKKNTKYDESNYIDKSQLTTTQDDQDFILNTSLHRLSFNGFSVVPPEGKEWSGLGLPDLSSGVSFTRDIRSGFLKKQLSTVVIRVSQFHLDDSSVYPDGFVKYLKTMDMLKEGSRQKEMKLNLTNEQFKGADCVRFNLNAKDDSAPNLKGKTLLITGIGLECIHPLSSNVHVSIVFTQRTLKDKKVKSLDDVGREFIRNLEFTEYQ